MHRILIIDDTQTNISILKDILRDTYHISTATSGERALEIVKKDPPDMILLDTMMPGMDGYEVCQRLKASKETATIPIIFVTTKEEVEGEEKGLTMGAVDYFTKPISPAITLTRIKNHIELKKMRDHIEELDEHSIQLRRKIDAFEARNKMNQFHLQDPDDNSQVLMVSLPMGRT